MSYPKQIIKSTPPILSSSKSTPVARASNIRQILINRFKIKYGKQAEVSHQDAGEIIEHEVDRFLRTERPTDQNL